MIDINSDSLNILPSFSLLFYIFFKKFSCYVRFLNLFSSFFSLSGKVRFVSGTAHALEEVEFQVQLISHLPLPVRFSRLLIPFNNKQYDCEILDEKDLNNLTTTTTTTTKLTTSSKTNNNYEQTELLLQPETPAIYKFTLSAKRKEELSVSFFFFLILLLLLLLSFDNQSFLCLFF
jgi:hypothetical protein